MRVHEITKRKHVAGEGERTQVRDLRTLSYREAQRGRCVKNKPEKGQPEIQEGNQEDVVEQMVWEESVLTEKEVVDRVKG